MLRSFKAKNYKSIKSLDFRMRPFMVLVGPNGAGKTNVVRALELFGEIFARGTTEPVREQGWEEIIHREDRAARGGLSFAVVFDLPEHVVAQSRRMAGAPPGPQVSVEIEVSIQLRGSSETGEVSVANESFAVRAGEAEFRVTAAAGREIDVKPGDDALVQAVAYPQRVLQSHRAVGVQGEVLRSPGKRPVGEGFADWFRRFGAEDSSGDVFRVVNYPRVRAPWMTYLAQISQVSRLRLDASALRSDQPVKEHAVSRLGPSGEGLAQAIRRLAGSGEKPALAFNNVLAALQKVYPRIEKVTPQRIAPGRWTLLFKERGIREAFDQSSVSDGVLHALAILVMLEGGERESGLLAIEEPENAIHPWSARSMIERAQERAERQVLVTTHSETVVNAIKDPASLYIVENGDDGTTVTPAPDKESALGTILQETGQKLGDVWMGGTLGGVPEQES